MEDIILTFMQFLLIGIGVVLFSVLCLKYPIFIIPVIVAAIITYREHKKP